MKEEMKKILLMGLGAISLTGEKAEDLKNELLEKGEKLYHKGSIKNEELKRDFKEKIKENTNIEFTSMNKEDLLNLVKDMNDEEKEELINLIQNCNNTKEENKKENNDEDNNQASEEQSN